MRRRVRGGGEEKDRRKKIERMKKRETELSHRAERDEEWCVNAQNSFIQKV